LNRYSTELRKPSTSFALLAIVNMRGVKDTGAAFIIPTFLFVSTLIVTVAIGMLHVFKSGGHPVAAAEMPHALPATVGFLSLWLLMKGLLQRLRRNDRRRSRLQRSDGIPRSKSQETRSAR